MSAKAYLIEHLLNPGFFVVPGFPNIMPRINRPPIGLNRSEIWAVVAFLESQGGTVDVALADVPAAAFAATGPGGSAGGSIELPGDPKAGQAVFTGKGLCFTCHKAGGVGVGVVGPDLSNIGATQTVDYVMGKILNPASKGTVTGFPAGVMPPTFGQQLTAKEYIDLVSFLMTLKSGPAASQTASKP
jgi:mono/diheme cytochrome c family protein